MNRSAAVLEHLPHGFMSTAQQLPQQSLHPRDPRLVPAACTSPAPEILHKRRRGSRERFIRCRERLVVGHLAPFASRPRFTAKVHVDAGGRTPIHERSQCHVLPSCVTKSPMK